MELYFELVLKTVLTIQGCFVIAGQSSHRAKAFLPHPIREEAGAAQGVEGGQAGTAEHSWPKGYSRPCGIKLS